MKLILAIVNSQDSDKLLAALARDGFRVTTAASAGGFLQRGNTTMLAIVDDDQIDRVTQIIQTVCGPPPQPRFYRPGLGTRNIGRATIFVLDVEHFESISGAPL